MKASSTLGIVVLFSTLIAISATAQEEVAIFDIQGAGHISPYLGEEVTTTGIVTAVAYNGYYVQDPEGDGDDRTSDGIFVFRFGSKPAVGDEVRLTDDVEEYIPGGAATGNLSITQFGYPTTEILSSDNTVPEPVIIGRGGRIPPNELVISPEETPVNLQDPSDAATNPFNPEEDGIDFYESLEGMLVTVKKPVAVSAIRQFGTYSAEVFVLAKNGRDIAPRDARTQRGGINLQPHPDNQGDQNPERIQIQFDSTLFGSTDYPSIKVGDRLGDVTGVVGYSYGNFEVNTLGEYPFTIKPSRIRPENTRRGSKHDLTVASYNVLNLSAIPGDDEQRNLIASQIANNLRGPDIVALQEIQDNNGDTNDCGSDKDPCSGELEATETLQTLVDAIAAAGGPLYSFFTVDPPVETTDDNRDDPDTFGGVSLGNIRNAFLYNPERVDCIEATGLTREELADRGVTASTAFDTSRDPLEGVFEFRGETVAIINNHFSSRFGSEPVFGGPQPFFQAAEDAREAQSLAMHELTAWWLAADDDVHVIVLGDLNTMEFTNDLTDILPAASGERILFNLVEKNRDDNVYSYIFEGNSQVLDHIFATQDLAKHASFDFVHVNADFPRLFTDVVGSDHEPLVAAFRFGGIKKEKDD
jgi:predicted extracellular nuclease